MSTNRTAASLRMVIVCRRMVLRRSPGWPHGVLLRVITSPGRCSRVEGSASRDFAIVRPDGDANADEDRGHRENVNRLHRLSREDRSDDQGDNRRDVSDARGRHGPEPVDDQVVEDVGDAGAGEAPSPTMRPSAARMSPKTCMMPPGSVVAKRIARARPIW